MKPLVGFLVISCFCAFGQEWEFGANDLQDFGKFDQAGIMARGRAFEALDKIGEATRNHFRARFWTQLEKGGLSPVAVSNAFGDMLQFSRHDPSYEMTYALLFTIDFTAWTAETRFGATPVEPEMRADGARTLVKRDPEQVRMAVEAFIESGDNAVLPPESQYVLASLWVRFCTKKSDDFKRVAKDRFKNAKPEGLTAFLAGLDAFLKNYDPNPTFGVPEDQDEKP
jgi:hypothetical protein